MRKRTLGKTGLEVSEIFSRYLGTLGRLVWRELLGSGQNVIERARAMGITLFETSQSYALGAMESELGATVATDPQVTIVTKWGTDRSESVAKKRFDPDYLKKSLETSRQRLGAEARLIALLHNPTEQTMKDGRAAQTLQEMAAQGDVLSWGVSVGSEEVARLAIDAGAPILSFAYNVLAVQPLRSVAALLKEKEIGVLAHSVLFYGLLTGQWTAAKTFRSSDHRSERWPEGTMATRIRHLDAIRPMISGEVTSLRSAALRFVLSNSHVHSAVLGPRTTGHLDQMVRDLKGDGPYLSEGKLSALESRLEHLEVAR